MAPHIEVDEAVGVEAEVAEEAADGECPPSKIAKRLKKSEHVA